MMIIDLACYVPAGSQYLCGYDAGRRVRDEMLASNPDLFDHSLILSIPDLIIMDSGFFYGMFELQISKLQDRFLDYHGFIGNKNMVSRIKSQYVPDMLAAMSLTQALIEELSERAHSPSQAPLELGRPLTHLRARELAAMADSQ